MRVQVRRGAGPSKLSTVEQWAETDVQVHLLEDGSIAVFSRNSENMSAKYPDLVEQIPRVNRALFVK